MKAVEGGVYFMLFGLIIGFLGLYLASFNPSFLAGSAFITIGFGWFISGIILFLKVEGNFNQTGGLLVFFLGLLGLILWAVFCEEEITYVNTSVARRRPEHVRCPKCGKDVNMAGYRYRWCPHCRAKLEET